MNDNVQAVLDVMIPLLIIMALGFLVGRFNVFHKNFMQTILQLNKFVFVLGIPALVFKGLATKDFFDLEWDFVLVFLIIRAIAGSICLIWVLITCGDLGLLLTHWIGSTWMNTVIFGIPLLQSLYGPKIITLNILAAISSLFFQLPTMLILFQLRNVWLAHKQGKTWFVNEDNEDDEKKQDNEKPNKTNNTDDTVEIEMQSPVISEHEHNEIDAEGSNSTTTPTTATGKVKIKTHHQNNKIEEWFHARVLRSRELYYKYTPYWLRIIFSLVFAILTNPPMIGIISGLLYSFIITSNDLRDDDETLPKWLDNLVTWVGNSVTPLAAFCVGLFMNNKFFHIPKDRYKLLIWSRIICHLIAKSLLLPLLAIPFLILFDIDGVQARSGVIIAALPVALASFSLAKKYHVGIAEQTSNIVLGTILMLPVVLMWTAILDSWQVFDDDDSDYQIIMPVAPPPTAITPTMLSPCNCTFISNSTMLSNSTATV